MTHAPWSLKNVTLSNIMGFLGTKEFYFKSGLQVIHANNHSGKTSFTNALLWGFTGKVPEIGKIRNKLADASDKTEIEIILENPKGEQLKIRRITNSTGKSFQLIVQHRSITYTDDEAENLISSQIGLKPQSFEGCSVVLQDQRLKLIAGDLKRSSEVIHDILGLATLSKLVPIFKDKLKALKALIKEFENNEHLKKWDEKHADLTLELAAKELEAIRRGYDPQTFKLKFLDNEFNYLAKKLDTPFKFLDQQPRDFATNLKQELSRQQNQNPYKNKLQPQLEQLFLLNESLKKVQNQKLETKLIETEYNNLLNKSHLQSIDITPKLKEIDFKITSLQSNLQLLERQNALFTHSLALLKTHQCTACPLCDQSINSDSLLKNIESKLGESLKESIEKQQNDLISLNQEKTEIEKLKLKFESLERKLESLTNQKYTKLDSLNELSTHLESEANTLQQQLQALSADHETLKSMSQDFDQELKPLDDRLHNIITYLIPVHDIHKKIFDHVETKNEIANQNQAHVALLEKTHDYIRQFEDLIRFLQTEEKNKANQIITDHQNFVSQFFVNVAENPHYNRITISAEQQHGSIKYDFQASSTITATLTEGAKHVLSGGDLSVACLGLMISLMKGKNNNTNFMVLDDPGESLDEIRMDNFAREIQKIAGHQTIILTHQADFAEHLKMNGASWTTLS